MPSTKRNDPAGFPTRTCTSCWPTHTALRLPRGHLVYARGNEAPQHYVVRGSGAEIVCHTLDLEQEPPEPLGQVGRLAASVAGGAAGPGRDQRNSTPLVEPSPTVDDVREYRYQVNQLDWTVSSE